MFLSSSVLVFGDECFQGGVFVGALSGWPG